MARTVSCAIERRLAGSELETRIMNPSCSSREGALQGCPCRTYFIGPSGNDRSGRLRGEGASVVLKDEEEERRT